MHRFAQLSISEPIFEQAKYAISVPGCIEETGKHYEEMLVHSYGSLEAMLKRGLRECWKVNARGGPSNSLFPQAVWETLYPHEYPGARCAWPCESCRQAQNAASAISPLWLLRDQHPGSGPP